MCRETIPECIGRVKLGDCYNFAIARAAAKISGASPNPVSQCTPASLRNQVSWRFAKRRVACWIWWTASFSLRRPARCFAQLRVADELERLRVCRDAARDERADFFQPSGCEHRIGACVNARVQRGARRLQADFDYFVALQRIAAAAMDFAHRFSGEQAQFDGADYFLRVRRRDARRGFGIETREHAMKMLRTVLFGRLPQARANFFGALRRLGQAFEQRAQIQPGPSGENRQNLARAQIRQGMRARDGDNHRP